MKKLHLSQELQDKMKLFSRVFIKKIMKYMGLKKDPLRLILQELIIFTVTHKIKRINSSYILGI